MWCIVCLQLLNDLDGVRRGTSAPVGLMGAGEAAR